MEKKSRLCTACPQNGVCGMTPVNNLCLRHKQYLKNKRAYANHKEVEQVYRDCGLTKVKGALGGIYWE